MRIVRRIAKWLAYGVLGIIVLAGVALCVLQTSWGKGVVRGRIEAKLGASINGRISIGAVDYSWLFHDIELRDVRIVDAAGQPAVNIASIHVSLDRGSLIHKTPVIEQLTIAGLDVTAAHLHGLAKPAPPGKPLASLTIENLRIDGAATIEKPDGTKVTVHNFAVGGNVHARPAAKEGEVVLQGLLANASIVRPGYPVRDIAISAPAISLGKRGDAIDVDLGSISAGVVTIQQLAAHLALANNKLAGAQSFKLAGVRIENTQLAALLGRDLLRDDATLDVSVVGPIERLAVDGAVHTGPSTLALTGTVDLSNAIVPRYDLTVTGTQLSSEIIAIPNSKIPPVTTSMKATVVGSGATRGGIDATLGVEVGQTVVGDVVLDGIQLGVTVHKGTLTVDKLHVSGPGLSVDGTAKMAPDESLDAAVTVHAAPPRIVEMLGKYGIAVPPRAPIPSTLDLAMTAHGRVDGTLAVDIAPTSIGIARGRVAISGKATLEHKQLAGAHVQVGIHDLDLGALARLAGKRPKVQGSVSGTLQLDKTATDRHARYDLGVALPAYGLAVSARGNATSSKAVATIVASRTRDRAVIATGAVSVPLAQRGGKPVLATSGPMAIKLDVARRTFAELAELLPADKHAKLNVAGDVEAHIDVRGTPARPAGTIDIDAHAVAVKGETQHVQLRADLASSAAALAVKTRGTVTLREGDEPIAVIDGTVTTRPLLVGGRLDAKALRSSAAVDATITIPPRELASLAWLRPPLAKLGGDLDGRIAVKGPVANPHVTANLTVDKIPTADGSTHAVSIVADGTPKHLTATVAYADALKVTASVDRSAADRIAVDARLSATKAALRTLIPAFLAPTLGPHSPGELDANLGAKLVLSRNAAGIAVESAEVTGTLDVSGGEVRVPDSTRRWRDIRLSLAAEPDGVRLKTLELHETDRETSERAVQASGFLRLDHFKPQDATLSLTTHKWLVSGTTSLGKNDAPRATLDADISVKADLRAPVLAIDATVNALALDYPERFDRAHQYENAALGGDIIYTDGGAGAGKLPYTAPPAPPAPHPRKPIDVHVHIPHPIKLQQPPIEIVAAGDVDVTIRDEGVTTRGALTFSDGRVALMGHPYKLVRGSFALTDEHPHGWLDATFEWDVPAQIKRDLSMPSAGAGGTISLEGPPANPKKTLGGANNGGLVDAMALNTTGHPAATSAPDMPASEVANLTRSESLQVLSFMAGNLPHLLFLDRMTAYSEPSGARDPYARLEHAEAERYIAGQRGRIRAVARPLTPGRSSAELQVDRMLIHSDHTAAGVGLRAGDRAGGGVGVFIEWSSD